MIPEKTYGVLKAGGIVIHLPVGPLSLRTSCGLTVHVTQRTIRLQRLAHVWCEECFPGLRCACGQPSGNDTQCSECTHNAQAVALTSCQYCGRPGFCGTCIDMHADLDIAREYVGG